MFELSQERIILYSDDGSIQLTTHRIIQRTEQGTNQIMLEDFENYEHKAAHIGNYYLITIIF